MHDLDSRICAIAAELENQARDEWLAALPDEKLERLAALTKLGISARTPIPPDVIEIIQTCPVARPGL